MTLLSYFWTERRGAYVTKTSAVGIVFLFLLNILFVYILADHFKLFALVIRRMVKNIFSFSCCL